MTLQRRQMMTLLGLTAASPLIGPMSASAQPSPSPQGAPPTESPSRNHFMKIPEDAPRIGMLVYDKMVLIDLVGPLTVFNILRSHIDLIGKTLDPVTTDVHLSVTPTATFETCRDRYDVLFVPGGLFGSIALLDDDDTLDWLADQGERAEWVTSVCTGSLVLGAAGLLKGYRATSHWGVTDLLPLMGAEISNDRVVFDRNRVTGGGATAGIDFGLALAAKLRDEETARRIQLTLEYSPAPPFVNGTPAEAGSERMEVARARRVGRDKMSKAAVIRATERRSIMSEN